uniref:Avh292 n=1 Tax=Phytophthora sojae TaxID=67593 RepID=G1FSN2_PHYSO|nr:Avh292 [Phytophthora sojae]
MRFYQATLVALVAFLASSASLSAAKAAVSSGRSLRVNSPVSPDDEDRAGGNLASLESTVRNVASLKGGQLSEASDDIVKKLLGLSEKALKPHKKYKYIMWDGSAVWNAWLKRHVTSFEAWAKVGLGKTTEDQLLKVMKTEAFKNYVSYLKVFDDAAVTKWKATGQGPLVSADATAGELAARSMVLAATNRDDGYAKLALGLGGLTGIALKKHANYPFYEKYYKAALAVAKKR